MTNLNRFHLSGCARFKSGDGNRTTGQTLSANKVFAPSFFGAKKEDVTNELAGTDKNLRTHARGPKHRDNEEHKEERGIILSI